MPEYRRDLGGQYHLLLDYSGVFLFADSGPAHTCNSIIHERTVDTRLLKTLRAVNTEAEARNSFCGRAH